MTLKAMQELAWDERACKYGIDGWDLRERLEVLVDEAVQCQDWRSLKYAISECRGLKKMAELILRLPDTEVDPEYLRKISKGDCNNTNPRILLQPILEKMKQGGWCFQKKIIEEKKCEACNGRGRQGNFDAPLERDVDVYPCGACNTKGRIRVITISGYKGEREEVKITTKDFLWPDK